MSTDWENLAILGLFIAAGILIGILLSQQPLGGQSFKAYSNIEEINWVDWRGRTRKVVIHRRAEIG